MKLYRCDDCKLIYGATVVEKPSEMPDKCRVCGGRIWVFHIQDEEF